MKQVDEPVYSILLVNFNMAPLVRRLIANVEKNVDGSCEILVADNSTDAANRLTDADAKGSSVRIIFLPENRGLVDALNRLFPLARGKFVMVMHPDVELVDGCPPAMRAFLESHPTAGVVSPDLVYPDGRPCKIRLRFPSVRSEARRLGGMLQHILLKRKSPSPEVLWDRAGNTPADMVMSVCMLFPRDALTAIGGTIDPRLRFYYANDYLCDRLGRSGRTCHYLLGAKAIHFERHTPTDMYSQTGQMLYKRSTVAANPAMRADYFAFLRSSQPLVRRVGFRLIAAAEDLLQLASQLKPGRERGGKIRALVKSILVDLGLKRGR